MAEAERSKANELLTFGIVTSNPKNVAWDPNHGQFAFQNEFGGQWLADFAEADGLPASAAIRNKTTGKTVATIVYGYAPQFFGGRLPSEFSRYAGSVVSEATKIEVVRIKSLAISMHHLPMANFDPGILYPSTNPNYLPLFYSNNIPYWTDADGNARPVTQPRKTP